MAFEMESPGSDFYIIATIAYVLWIALTMPELMVPEAKIGYILVIFPLWLICFYMGNRLYHSVFDT